MWESKYKTRSQHNREMLYYPQHAIKRRLESPCGMIICKFEPMGCERKRSKARTEYNRRSRGGQRFKFHGEYLPKPIDKGFRSHILIFMIRLMRSAYLNPNKRRGDFFEWIKRYLIRLSPWAKSCFLFAVNIYPVMTCLSVPQIEHVKDNSPDIIPEELFLFWSFLILRGNVNYRLDSLTFYYAKECMFPCFIYPCCINTNARLLCEQKTHLFITSP